MRMAGEGFLVADGHPDGFWLGEWLSLVKSEIYTFCGIELEVKSELFRLN